MWASKSLLKKYYWLVDKIHENMFDFTSSQGYRNINNKEGLVIVNHHAVKNMNVCV